MQLTFNDFKFDSTNVIGTYSYKKFTIRIRKVISGEESLWKCYVEHYDSTGLQYITLPCLKFKTRERSGMLKDTTTMITGISLMKLNSILATIISEIDTYMMAV